MVECPRCGVNITDLKSECDICGYEPVWEDYYDYNLLDIDFYEKILKLNSYDIIDIIREKKQIKPQISNLMMYCPRCNSVHLYKKSKFKCKICGYKDYFMVDEDILWDLINKEHYYAPFDFIEKNKLDNFWYILGEEYYELNEFDKALLCYKKAIELNESNVDAWFKKSLIYESFDQDVEKKKARKNMFKYANKQLKNNPHDEENLNLKGLAFMKFKDFKTAFKYFEQAIKLNPNNPEYMVNLGDCCVKLKRYDRASKLYEDAINIDETNCRAWIQLGLLHKEYKEYHLMLKCFNKAITINKHDYVALKNIANYYYENEKYFDAIEYYNLITTFFPESEFAWENKGDCYYILGFIKEAKYCYEQVIEINPENEYAIEFLDEMS